MQPLEPDSPPGTPRPWLSGAGTRVALAARPRCLVRPHGAARSLPPRQDRGGVSPCESPRVRGQFNDSQSVLNDWTALTRSRAILAGDLFLPYVKNSNLLAQDLASCLWAFGRLWGKFPWTCRPASTNVSGPALTARVGAGSPIRGSPY